MLSRWLCWFVTGLTVMSVSSAIMGLLVRFSNRPVRLHRYQIIAPSLINIVSAVTMTS